MKAGKIIPKIAPNRWANANSQHPAGPQKHWQCKESTSPQVRRKRCGGSYKMWKNRQKSYVYGPSENVAEDIHAKRGEVGWRECVGDCVWTRPGGLVSRWANHFPKKQEHGMRPNTWVTELGSFFEEFVFFFINRARFKENAPENKMYRNVLADVECHL